MIPWICLHNITGVVTQQIVVLFLICHLNAYQTKWSELTKLPLIRHLSEFFVQFRLKVLGSASMRYINITSRGMGHSILRGIVKNIKPGQKLDPEKKINENFWNHG